MTMRYKSNYYVRIIKYFCIMVR